MTTLATVQKDPSYELIPTFQSNSILYRQHGFPDPLVQWHYHKEYELHLITHSTGKVFVGDYIGNFYPNNLILTGPNLPHNWITQAENGEVYPERDRVVVFTDEWVQSAKVALPEMASLDDLLQRSRFGIEFHDKTTILAVRELIYEIARSDGLARLSLFLKAMSLLAETDQFQILSSNKHLTINGKKDQHRVNKVVEFIFERYNLDLSLDEAAEHIGMEPTYFSKFFRRATGRRFVEFVNSLRITRACDLLAHSNIPITDLCFEVGFTNISNFNRRFQAMKGMTPSEYRKLAAVASSIQEKG